MLDKQKILDEFGEIDFDPIINAFDESQRNQIKYETTSRLFKNSSQGVLIFLRKAKMPLLFAPIIYGIIVYVFSTLLHVNIFGKVSFVIGPILIIIAVLMLMTKVTTTVASTRAKMFRHQNKSWAFWKANDLNKSERKVLDSDITVYHLTGRGKEVAIKNVLALTNVGFQTGDAYYTDDSENSNQATGSQYISYPYSRLDVKPNLPEMKIWRKSVAMLNIIQGNSIPLNGTIQSNLSVYPGNTEVRIDLKNLFRNSQVGDSFDDLFEHYRGLLGVEILNDYVILIWMKEIAGHFDTPDMVDANVPLQYQTRLQATLDVFDIIEQL